MLVPLAAVALVFLAVPARGERRPVRAPSSVRRPSLPVSAAASWERGREKEEREDWSGASRDYRRLVNDYPGSELAPEAQFRLGVCLEKTGRLVGAFQAYRELLRRYPGKGNLGEILERELRIGEVFLEGKKLPFLFLPLRSGLSFAAEVFQGILETAAFSDVSPRAQYDLGLIHYRRGRYEEAEVEFDRVVTVYSLSGQVPDALFMLGLCAYERALRADYDQFFVSRAARWFETFIRRCPDHPRREEAKTKLADLLGRQAEKLYRVGHFYQRKKAWEGARVYYGEIARRFPDTSWAKKADSRLKEMEAKSR
jgi:outer membrane protein assembly factor BamD